MGVTNFDSIQVGGLGQRFVVSNYGLAIGLTTTATAQASAFIFVATRPCKVVGFRVGIDPIANSAGMTGVNLMKNPGADGLNAVSVLSAAFAVTAGTGGAAGTVLTTSGANLAAGDCLNIQATSAVDAYASFSVELEWL